MYFKILKDWNSNNYSILLSFIIVRYRSVEFGI